MTFEEHETAWRKAFTDAGHVFVITVPDEDDPDVKPQPDMWRVAYGPHNGPECAVCGWSCCQHCQPMDSIPACKGGKP